MKRHAVLLVGAGVLAALATITWQGSLGPARAFQQGVMGAFLAMLYLAGTIASAPDWPLDRQQEVAWGEFALCVAVGFAAAALWVRAHPLEGWGPRESALPMGPMFVMSMVYVFGSALSASQRQAMTPRIGSLAMVAETSGSGLAWGAALAALAALAFLARLPAPRPRRRRPMLTRQEVFRDTMLRPPGSPNDVTDS
jgi:hypothetical protein